MHFRLLIFSISLIFISCSCLLQFAGARGTELSPPFFLTNCLHIYFQDHFFISLLFHLFFLIHVLSINRYYIYHGSYELTYLNLFCNRNYMNDRFMTSKSWNNRSNTSKSWNNRSNTSKSWNNRSMTSKSWNNIKIFMLDHGL